MINLGPRLAAGMNLPADFRRHWKAKWQHVPDFNTDVRKEFANAHESELDLAAEIAAAENERPGIVIGEYRSLGYCADGARAYRFDPPEMLREREEFDLEPELSADGRRVQNPAKAHPFALRWADELLAGGRPFAFGDNVSLRMASAGRWNMLLEAVGDRLRGVGIGLGINLQANRRVCETPLTHARQVAQHVDLIALETDEDLFRRPGEFGHYLQILRLWLTAGKAVVLVPFTQAIVEARGEEKARLAHQESQFLAGLALWLRKDFTNWRPAQDGSWSALWSSPQIGVAVNAYAEEPAWNAWPEKFGSLRRVRLGLTPMLEFDGGRLTLDPFARTAATE